VLMLCQVAAAAVAAASGADGNSSAAATVAAASGSGGTGCDESDTVPLNGVVMNGYDDKPFRSVCPAATELSVLCSPLVAALQLIIPKKSIICLYVCRVVLPLLVLQF